MKKNVLIKAVSLALIAYGMTSCSGTFDPTYLDNEINKIKDSVQDLATRLSTLEKTVSTVNQDVKEIKALYDACKLDNDAYTKYSETFTSISKELDDFLKLFDE